MYPLYSLTRREQSLDETRLQGLGLFDSNLLACGDKSVGHHAHVVEARVQLDSEAPISTCPDRLVSQGGTVPPSQIWPDEDIRHPMNGSLRVDYSPTACS